MKIALDISPLSDTKKIAHRVRGIGFYVRYLREYLPKYFPENSYVFFDTQQEIPEDTDIVHIPYFEPFFITLPFFKKYKTIVTIHDLTPLVFPNHFPSGVKGLLKWNLQRFLLKNIDAIIADSECSKKDIISYANIPAHKTSIVYLAASEEFRKLDLTSTEKTLVREKYNLPEKFVLYVGDVTWNKNLPRLVAATKKIKTHLVLVGGALTKTDVDTTNPWNKDLIAVQKAIRGDKNVSSLGFIPTKDLVSIYNLATVFVMPSLYEGFGLPVLEAMSCGCPVVTSRAGSIEEIAEDAVHYIDEYNVDNISQGINAVFSNQKTQSDLSKKGLEQAKKFSWKKSIHELMRVYEKENSTNN